MPLFKKSFQSFVGHLFGTDTEQDTGTDLATAALPAPRQQATPKVEKPDTYWWEEPRPPAEEILLVEGLDGEAIADQLQSAINSGSFRMIDIPANVFRCLEILNQPDFDYVEVQELISRSPVLASNIITIANSPMYNRGTPITKLGVALPRLGCGKTKAILYFASCEHQLSNSPLFSEVATLITEHSYTTALIANYLSFRYFPDSDNAFLAGLLHDVGKLALLKEMAANYSFGRNRQGGALTEESYGNILPDYHQQVGAMVASHWGMSQSIRHVIAHHHDLKVDQDEDGAYDQCLVHLVHLSDVCARLLGYGRPIDPLPLPELVETLLPEVTWDDQVAQFFQAIRTFVQDRRAPSV